MHEGPTQITAFLNSRLNKEHVLFVNYCVANFLYFWTNLMTKWFWQIIAKLLQLEGQMRNVNKAVHIMENTLCIVMLWSNGCILGCFAALTAMGAIQWSANNGFDFHNCPSHRVGIARYTLLLTLPVPVPDTHKHLQSKHIHLHSRFSVLN